MIDLLAVEEYPASPIPIFLLSSEQTSITSPRSKLPSIIFTPAGSKLLPFFRASTAP